MRRTIRRTAAPLLVALALGGLAACGDDDEGSDEATTDTSAGTDDSAGEPTEEASEGDVETYCEASLAIETAPEPEIDFETATPEQQAEAAKTYASETLLPLARDAEAAAPEEVAADVETAITAVEGLAETGDFEGFETPETEEAFDRLHDYDLENCGWGVTEVTGVDYAFEGIPPELEAGPHSFEFANETSAQEVHELVVLRKNDGVTMSAQELLALPQEEAMTMVTMVAIAFADPGESDYGVGELEPGEYIASCFIPTGASEANPEGTGPPHFVQGMVAEFTVQ